MHTPIMMMSLVSRYVNVSMLLRERECTQGWGFLEKGVGGIDSVCELQKENVHTRCIMLLGTTESNHAIRKMCAPRVSFVCVYLPWYL